MRAATVVVDELTLIGSRCGFFGPALTLLENRQIQVEALISARFSLNRAVAAFDRAGRRGELKVIVEMAAG